MTKEEVLQAVRDHPGLDSRDLAGRMGWDRHKTAAALSNLRKAGKVHNNPLRWWVR